MERERQTDPREAFDKAIREGRLSETESDRNFAGKYMFMGTHEGRDLFKSINFRSYDV